MHRKAVFFLAGVFLVVALVAPPIILILQADRDLDNYIVTQTPNGLQTNGNITTTSQIEESHQATFILVLVIEVVFVSLFVVTLYYGINHPHPQH